MSNPWYARYPGDYGKDTGHLTIIEHGAYTLLMDHYYTVEGPIGRPQPKDRKVAEQMQSKIINCAENLYRVCRAFTEEERTAVDNVLSEFFHLTVEGYRNDRADREIATRKEKCTNKKIGAQARWGKNTELSRGERQLMSKVIATHTKKEWLNLLSEYGNECCKCGVSFDEVKPTKDHIIPLCKGGNDGIDNLQPLCQSCNSGRSGAVEDFRLIAKDRLLLARDKMQGHLHTQPQPQSHINNNSNSAGEVDQEGDKKTTSQEMRFIECFDDHEADLKRVFPHADYEAEKLKCIAHYAKGPSVGPDPWPTVSKWFGRIPKPTTRQTLPDVRTENYEAAREFCNDAR